MVHGNREKQACSICEKYFTKPWSLRRHVKSMHSATPRERIPCPFDTCDKTFLTKDARRVHFKTEHAINSALFPCAICGREFKHKGDLIRNIGVHTREKPFKCSTCGRSFQVKKLLTRHEVAENFIINNSSYGLNNFTEGTTLPRW